MFQCPLGPGCRAFRPISREAGYWRDHIADGANPDVLIRYKLSTLKGSNHTTDPQIERRKSSELVRIHRVSWPKWSLSKHIGSHLSGGVKMHDSVQDATGNLRLEGFESSTRSSTYGPWIRPVREVIISDRIKPPSRDDGACRLTAKVLMSWVLWSHRIAHLPYWVI